MATIGTFIASGNGFSGTVKTLSLNVKAKLVPVERSNEKSPDFRILASKASSLARPGRRPRNAANTSRSSSTIQASQHRSSQH